MALSMTGFGRAEMEYKNSTVTCEIRSVNNRFCETNFRLPRKLMIYEDPLRELVKREMVRGRIDVSFTFSQMDNNNDLPVLNEKNVKHIVSLIYSLKQSLDNTDPIALSDILQFGEIWKPEEISEDETEMLEILKTVLLKVMKSVNSMRKMEGDNISADLKKRVERISESLADIRKIAKGRSSEEFAKMMERINLILDNEQRLEKERVEMEIALLMDKLDISEECVRLDSHCMLFLHELDFDKSIGKKLDFILQEMNREANTIASKSNNADISHHVVNIKNQIEKIREQSRNIL